MRHHRGEDLQSLQEEDRKQVRLCWCGVLRQCLYAVWSKCLGFLSRVEPSPQRAVTEASPCLLQCVRQVSQRRGGPLLLLQRSPRVSHRAVTPPPTFVSELRRLWANLASGCWSWIPTWGVWDRTRLGDIFQLWTKLRWSDDLFLSASDVTGGVRQTWKSGSWEMTLMPEGTFSALHVVLKEDAPSGSEEEELWL